MGENESCGGEPADSCRLSDPERSVRANRYLNALKEQRYVEGTQILDTKAFTQLVHAFEDAKRNGLTECTLVKIDSDKKLEKKGKKISVLLRQSDYIGTMEDSLYVLLPNTDQKMQFMW